MTTAVALSPESWLCTHNESMPGLRAGNPLKATVFERVRRRAVLEGCKWDPQVGDVSTLASFPLLLSRSAWRELVALTEELAAETVEAEKEILERPELLRCLGLPTSVASALRGQGRLTPGAARVMRFDFHPTTDGWKLSEVNSDVPGGFTEASFFTGLVAAQAKSGVAAGTPIELWASAVAVAAGHGRVGLLSAPGFMEDHQVVSYLAGHLRKRGCETHLANPKQLKWRNGIAFLDTDWASTELHAIVRFYQGEWLSHLPRRLQWTHFFRGGHTPVGNPGVAMISESKRFPLTWDRLKTSLPAWKAALPETREPRDCPWQTDHGWLLKAALSNTGDEVCIREWVADRKWRRLRWNIRLQPSSWVAQRRFEAVPLDTPTGPMHVCLGVYAINGRTAGIYGRLAPRALIDYASIDVAVLIADEHDEGRTI